jgi:hypothetical protein
VATGSNAQEDCLKSVTGRILFELMNDINGAPAWPEHPSQLVVWTRMATIDCGLPDSPAGALSDPGKACMGKKGRAMGTTVVAGLRSFLAGGK